MKKYLFILATAAIVASCAENDSFKEINTQGNDEAISFSSYTQPATRAENSPQTAIWDFFNHHGSFQVWAYKNTQDERAFNADVVSVTEASPSGYNYSYEPARYWDKGASTYYFYAAAPGDDSWTFQGTPATKSTSYFERANVVLVPSNLQATPDDELANSFKNVTDIDLLIASPCVVNKAQFFQTVQFHFNHILSKLNVSIKTGNNLDTDGQNNDDDEVILTSFAIEKLVGKGSFNESTAAAVNTAAGTPTTRWTLSTDANDVITYSATANYTVVDDSYYIIESLVIPQSAGQEYIALDGTVQPVYYTWAEYTTLGTYNATEVPSEAAFNDLFTDITLADYNTAYPGANVADIAVLKATIVKANTVAIANATEPYLKIDYTINDDAFTAYYNLATVFNTASLTFHEGWQHTLNITINPQAIEFSADVYQWQAETPDGAVTVD